jgi:hypothetical protein
MLRKFKFLKKNFAEVNQIPIMKSKGRIVTEQVKEERVDVIPTYKPSAAHSLLLKFCADYVKLYTNLHSQIYTDTIKKMIEEKINNIENSSINLDEKVGNEKIANTQQANPIKTIKEAEQLLIKTIKHDEKFKLEVGLFNLDVRYIYCN